MYWYDTWIIIALCTWNQAFHEYRYSERLDQRKRRPVKRVSCILYIFSQKGKIYFSLDNVVVGGACIYNEQCKGTEHSGLCSHGTCACERGYIFINQHCHEGRNKFRFWLNLFFEEVSYSVQCVNVYAGIFSLTKQPR